MTALRIAWRYLISKKSHGAVNIISIVAMAGVAVATAAIVIVLSVFNGFTNLALSHLAAIDPDLKIVPVQGKSIDNADSLTRLIVGFEGVEAAAPVIEERALMIYDNTQMPVIFKGLPMGYENVVPVRDIIIDGEFMPDSSCLPPELAQEATSAISVGVAMNMGLRPEMMAQAQVCVPRRVGRINAANPMAAFRQEKVLISGVFEVEQPEYDGEYIFLPLETARTLLDYENEATAIEVKQSSGSQYLQQHIQEVIGPTFKVLTRHQQQESSFKMIMVEKWITFMMLAFILVIASFNIISTLSLMVIEKRDNMATLRALGASLGMVRNVFMWQGFLITAGGGIIGVGLGTILALAQQHGKFIKLAGDPSQLTIDAYPVEVNGLDLLAVICLICLVAIVISLIGAAISRRTKLELK